MRTAPLALALLVGLFGPGVAAEECTAARNGCPKVENDLNTRKDLINKLKKQVEDNYKHLNTNGNGTVPTSAYFAGSGRFPIGNKSLDACGGLLPNAWSPDCDRTYGGDTKGCECEGTSIVDHIVVKALNEKFANAKRNAGNLAAFAANDEMKKAYQNVRSKNKWMYFGAADGSYALYPGRLWPRDNDGGDGAVPSKCGAKYDPRLRPWYLSAATGPKNVIFILDSSGSMGGGNPGNVDRMQLLKTAAKKIVDALGFADYFGLVDFNRDARTFQNLNFLAPAGARFRDEAKLWIDKLKPDLSTNYKDAIIRAWKMAVS